MSSNFYPPLNLSQAPYLNETEKVSPYIATAHDAAWITQDLEFSQELSEHWKTRREVYRALFIKECPRLKELDHLFIDPTDRDYADTVIDHYQQSRSSFASTSQ